MDRAMEQGFADANRETERIKLILMIVVFTCGAVAGLLLGCLKKDYPSADSLSYVECTFIRHEDSKGKNRCCYIYVEEYEKPLEITGITKPYTDHAMLLATVKSGDTIRVSMDGEGRFSISLYYLSHDRNVILSYEGYLAGQNRNDSVRMIFGWVMFTVFTATMLYQIAAYRKTGKLVPVYSRFSPDRPKVKDTLRARKRKR